MGFHLGRIWGVPLVLALPGMAVFISNLQTFEGNEARHETNMDERSRKIYV